MSFSIYAATVPPMRLMLKNLSVLLSKAQSHCQTRKIEPSALLEARLFPDMFTLTRQVQIVCDVAKGAGARLAGIEPPKQEDNEVGFEALQARIEKTIAFLDSLAQAQFEGAEARPVVQQVPGRTFEFTGADFLTTWANPNLYFHITVVYALLRHNGVELGKSDYLRGGV